MLPQHQQAVPQVCSQAAECEDLAKWYGGSIAHQYEQLLARQWRFGVSRVWTLVFGYREDRTPTHGYEATREAAMAAFKRSWSRQ